LIRKNSRRRCLDSIQGTRSDVTILASEWAILRGNLISVPETPVSARLGTHWVERQSRIETDRILHMGVALNFPTEPLQEPVAARDTAISCLVRLGVQNGVDLEIENVRSRIALDGDTLAVSRLIELADEFGLQAEWTRLDWEGLTTTGFTHPIFIFRKDTNAVVLTGGGRAGAEEVSVWDPHHDGVIFFVRREEFERAWNGHTLIITPREQRKTFDASPREGGEDAIASDTRDAGTPRRSRSLLFGLAPVGVLATAGIGAFLLIHPGPDKVAAISPPAGEEGVMAARGTPSTGEPAARPSAVVANAPAGPTTDAALAIATPAPAEPRGGPMPNTARPLTMPKPAVASIAAMPEPTALTAGQPSSAATAPTTPSSEATSEISAAVEPLARPAPFAATAAATPSSEENVAAATPEITPIPLARPQPSAAEIAALLARGDTLLSKGDLVAARLFYERAADAGEGQAAVRLGETFDPGFLEHARLRGARGDLTKASTWYRRARDLGAPEAEILLNSLESK
jgi:hypothetical protein